MLTNLNVDTVYKKYPLSFEKKCFYQNIFTPHSQVVRNQIGAKFWEVIVDEHGKFINLNKIQK